MQARQLGVGAEAAAGKVDGFDLVAEQRLCRVQSAGVDDDDGGGCTDGPEGPLCQGLRGRCGRHRDVPPDVTTGRVVVVVGGGVVVVVVGANVVGTVAGVELPPEVAGVVGVDVVGVAVVVVVGGDVVVDVVGGSAGVVPLGLAPELAPGCSFATTTPISAVAPVAAITAERVRRRRRMFARSRASGELRSGLIGVRSSRRPSGPITSSIAVRRWREGFGPEFCGWADGFHEAHLTPYEPGLTPA